MTVDSRLTLVREDLASQALEGLVRAPRFVTPSPRQAAEARLAIRRSPDRDAEQVSQLILGERFDIIDECNGFAWGQAARDGYVGWVDIAGLTDGWRAPTHRVTALSTFRFASPSLKSPASGPVSLNALVSVEEIAGDYARLSAGGWMPSRHLTPVGEDFAAPATTAEVHIGTPYLWGGRDSQGLDCSGLVQQCMFAAGLACPRDSDQQAQLGRPAPTPDLIRGDLVFWAGHVGMMLDAERLIHANAFHMAVAVEPLCEAVDRIDAKGGGHPIAYRRPDLLPSSA